MLWDLNLNLVLNCSFLLAGKQAMGRSLHWCHGSRDGEIQCLDWLRPANVEGRYPGRGRH